MPNFRMKFKVQGCGTFPTDMLRYDSCSPVGVEDVLNISLHSYDCDMEEWAATRSVVLMRIITSVPKAQAEAQGVTVGRWASFGWKVVEQNVRKL